MLTRKRYREVPPRVDYELTERARELMPILGELARWGYVWAWSPPRSSESVDVGAIFRLAPGLLLRAADGTVEFVVDRGDCQAAYTFTLAGDGANIEERPADSAEARVRGTTEDWIRAFSPERDRTGLELSGDRALAEAVLDGLAAVGRRTSARAEEAA